MLFYEVPDKRYTFDSRRPKALWACGFDQRPTITVTATRAARLTIRVRGAHGYRRSLHASVGAGQTRVSLPRLPPGALSARFIAHAGPRVATASVSISN